MSMALLPFTDMADDSALLRPKFDAHYFVMTVDRRRARASCSGWSTRTAWSLRCGDEVTDIVEIQLAAHRTDRDGALRGIVDRDPPSDNRFLNFAVAEDQLGPHRIAL